MVTDLAGQIQPDTDQGVFAHDTRFVSYYAISANGVAWQRLSSAATAYYAARVYLTKPLFGTEDGSVPAGSLSLVISRTIGEGVHEDLDVANHGLATVRFNLELALRADSYATRASTPAT
jgi:N-terminal domain of (some) glycogen debranching enzymes